MRAKHFLELYEAQQDLFEVEMSPSNLKKLAAAVPGAMVGMEFEMVVPGAQGDDDDFEPEADYDYDERANDIDDIVDFFGREDDYMGQTNGPRDLDSLREELNEKFYEWQNEKIDEEWTGADGLDFFRTWLKENLDPDTLSEILEKGEDLFGNPIAPDKDDWEKYTQEQWDDQGDLYDSAQDAFREEKQDEGDFNEGEFLRDINIRNMSDVNRAISGYISWPFYTQSYGGDGEGVESIGDEFSDAIGKKVYTSTSYHGARRAPDAYSLEPDSSIDASSGEAGLEFISPPMPVDEMLEDLQAVKKWADQRGAYTNRSTGLHINVSVPDYSRDDLDYVKLAILLGDKYVLEQFGRIGNSYARSALDIIKDRANSPEDVDRLLKQLKGNMETIASKLIHSGRTDKFTSINTKDDYVEFRSAGGDWLNKNFEKIQDTLLRFVVALDAACDPNKYKKEYLKGLYKLLKPKDPKSDMSYFARYMSGEMTRSEYVNTLEKSRTERFRGQGIRILKPDEVEEGDWVVEYDDGNKQDAIYIANTDSVPNDAAAFKAAQKFKPAWFKPNTVEYISVKPYQFDEALNDLKLYRAEYGHKYSSVVAKDEAQANEFVKIMDPEYFAVNPEAHIELTDENETSKRKLNQMNDWTMNKIAAGEDWLIRPKIWTARGTASEPAFANRYYIAAKTRDEAVDVLNRLDSGFEMRDMYVDHAAPSQDTYDAYQQAQEDLIRQYDMERAQRQAAQAAQEYGDEGPKFYATNDRTGETIEFNSENGMTALGDAEIKRPDWNRTDITVSRQPPVGYSAAIQQQPGSIDFGTEFVVRNNTTGEEVTVTARNPAAAQSRALQDNPNWDSYTQQIRVYAAPNAPHAPATYIVLNNDIGREVTLQAGSEQNARGRAIREYPDLFTPDADITIRRVA